MFGTPGSPHEENSRVPETFKANLGVLQEGEVNIVVHGHEPLLSEMIAVASRDPELIDMAKDKGAAGINVSGICCTANEILMRHGIPVAGNFLQQELAISTGAVEMMLVDVQCIMQSLGRIANDFHTEVVTTTEKAKMIGTSHVEFDEDDALNSARELVKRAINNFPNRQGVDIPEAADDAVSGFSHEYIRYMLGGSFRNSYWPLNSNIIDGRIRGVVGVVGCNNAAVPLDEVHVPLVKELIANDVLVVQTGCAAIASAKAGLMKPEVASEMAGSGLAEVCEAWRSLKILEKLADCENWLRNALNKRVYLEVILIKVMHYAHSVPIDQVIERLNQLRDNSTAAPRFTEAKSENVNGKVTPPSNGSGTMEAKTERASSAAAPTDDNAPPSSARTQSRPDQQAVPDDSREPVSTTPFDKPPPATVNREPTEPAETPVETPVETSRNYGKNEEPAREIKEGPHAPAIAATAHASASSQAWQEKITQPENGEQESNNLETKGKTGKDKPIPLSSPEIRKKVENDPFVRKVADMFEGKIVEARG